MSAAGLSDPQFITALFAGLASLLIAVATLLVAMRTKGAVAEVHELTNSRLTDMVHKQTVTDLRVEQLLGALNRLGAEVPVAPGAVVSDHPVIIVPPPVKLSGEGDGPIHPVEPAL